MKRRLTSAASAVCLFFPALVNAQDAAPAPSPAPIFGAAGLARALGPEVMMPVDLQAKGAAKPNRDADRRCPGCPVRRLVRPYFESLAVNFMYNGINHARGHDTAKITFKTMWLNLRHGFEWDDNPWGVNQIGHPYQGSNYFTSGRAHGLTFWEATAVAAYGSATWEFLFENNRASLNDLINTTLGGIALGEMMHRVGWLIRDPTLTGKGRGRKEFIASILSVGSNA
jgi:hypothetical protein